MSFVFESSSLLDNFIRRGKFPSLFPDEFFLDKGILFVYFIFLFRVFICLFYIL